MKNYNEMSYLKRAFYSVAVLTGAVGAFGVNMFNRMTGYEIKNTTLPEDRFDPRQDGPLFLNAMLVGACCVGLTGTFFGLPVKLAVTTGILAADGLGLTKNGSFAVVKESYNSFREFNATPKPSI